MLVIISDLHLNDGTTGATLAPGAASLFIQRLRETALSASWRADGAYRPVERIDLVLLGDTFDLLHSEHWRAAPTVRPWGDLHAPEFFDQIATITKGILTQNQESLAMFRAVAAESAITLPPMLRLARPAQPSDEQPVSVRIHYMVGNHDWFLHVAGADTMSCGRRWPRRWGWPAGPIGRFPTTSPRAMSCCRRCAATR